LWLEAPLATLRARIAGRTGDASDATLDVLERVALRDTGFITWHRLDAREPAPAARKLLDLPVPSSP